MGFKSSDSLAAHFELNRVSMTLNRFRAIVRFAKRNVVLTSDSQFFDSIFRSFLISLFICCVCCVLFFRLFLFSVCKKYFDFVAGRPKTIFDFNNSKNGKKREKKKRKKKNTRGRSNRKSDDDDDERAESIYCTRMHNAKAKIHYT